MLKQNQCDTKGASKSYKAYWDLLPISIIIKLYCNSPHRDKILQYKSNNLTKRTLKI